MIETTIGQGLYTLLLGGCFIALLLIIGVVWDIAERRVKRRKRAELRRAQHKEAAADMAEMDRLYRHVLNNEIRGDN